MEALKEFYGKELLCIDTVFKDGKIHHSTVIKKVYDPYDLSRRIRPFDGCDIVIGDNSTNSKYIFSIGGIQHSATLSSFVMVEQISIFTYCQLEESEQVMKLHVQEVMKILNKFYVTYSKKVNNVKEWIENLQYINMKLKTTIRCNKTLIHSDGTTSFIKGNTYSGDTCNMLEKLIVTNEQGNNHVLGPWAKHFKIISSH